MLEQACQGVCSGRGTYTTKTESRLKITAFAVQCLPFIDQNNEYNGAMCHHSIVWNILGDKHRKFMRLRQAENGEKMRLKKESIND